MSNKWTDSQSKTIYTRGKNILVSAAAGSGKTAVLVERIISLITDESNPVDIDSIVIVTFTRAAAAEMRERILKRILNLLEADPHNANLLRQSTLVHKALICTIDSFCGYVVRNFYYELGIDPVYRMANETELKQLGTEVLSQLMDERYASNDEAFLALVDAYGGSKSDERLAEMVLDLYGKADSFPWPMQWLDGLLEPYNATTVNEMINSSWFSYIITHLRRVMADLVYRLEAMQALCMEPDGPDYFIAHFEKEIEDFTDICNEKNDIDFLKAIASFSPRRMATDKSTSSEHYNLDKCAWVKEERKSLIAEFAKIQEDYVTFTLEEQLGLIAQLRPMVEALISLVKDYVSSFEAKKRKSNIYGFSDIAHFALQILVDAETKEPTAVARTFQGQFSQIMIDEYQDSNYIQEAILTSIAKEGSLFMVGDVKQSIYAFRQACPEIFTEKYARYKAEATNEEALNLAQDLTDNFRSRAEVLQVTNSVFRKLMQADLGGIDYDDAAALKFGAEYYNAMPGEFNAEILAVDCTKAAMSETEYEDDISAEAQAIADRINALKDSGFKVIDKVTRTQRNLEYSDVVILMRSPGKLANKVIDVLLKNKIPAYTESKTGYFSTMEVTTVLNLLRVIDNPLQSIPMAAVLSSPIVGMSSEELAVHSSKNSYIATPETADVIASYEAKKASFDALLAKYRAMVPETSIHQLLVELLDETGYLSYATALPGGQQRRANLMRLLEEAIAFEKSSFKGLFSFVRYIEDLHKYKFDMGEVSLISENDNAVPIISIHGSKGLEYPVVFVAGLGSGFNRKGSEGDLLVNTTSGMGLRLIDAKNQIIKNDLIYKTTQLAINNEQDGEELRLLYVAMTRAKEKLILVGSVKSAKRSTSESVEEIISKWNRPLKELPFSQRQNPKCPFEWIIRATAEEREQYPITVIHPEDTLVHAVADEMRQRSNKQALLERVDKVGSSEIENLQKLMTYTYPYSSNLNIKNKYSVSEIKHARMEEAFEGEDESARPEFAKEKERKAVIPRFISANQENENQVNAGALYGTAVHRFLECYDFTQEPSAEELDSQLESVVSGGYMSSEDVLRLNKTAILKFLQSTAGHRMHEAAVAGLLSREQPFVMSVAPSQLFEGATDVDEDVLIQGIIDVFWQEDDQIILLDYKTDKVKSPEELDKRYRAQLELYANALERSLGLLVKEKILYSFCLGECVILE